MGIVRTHGFSASWVVPFAARIFVEKLRCPLHALPEWELKIAKRSPQHDIQGGPGAGNREDGGDGDGARAMGEWVRVIVNERVIPLGGQDWNYHEYGLVKLEEFVDMVRRQSEEGGWEKCFGPL